MTTKVALLFDRNNMWIFDFFQNHKFDENQFSISLFFDAAEVKNFDIVFLLGYTSLLPKTYLKKNALILVIHESNLPKGKGFAPIQWQLLEGASEICVSLIEATEKVDGGDIFFQTSITFNGTELFDEIRKKQASASIKLVEKFLDRYPNISRTKQSGQESFYPKRTMADNELDIKATIEENFNLLRIGNNEFWPSYFYYQGTKYIIKIYKE